MAFITDIRTADPSTGVYFDSLPSGVDNDLGLIRGDIGADRSATASGLWLGSSLGDVNRSAGLITLGSHVARAIIAGQFNRGLQVVVRSQTTIAGLANTTLLGGDSNSASNAYTPLQLAKQREYFYGTSVRRGDWNVFSGVFSPAVTAAYSGAWDIDAQGIGVDNAPTLRASGTDFAANPTQGTPGRLTYLVGNPIPTNDVYNSKSNW